MISQVTNFKLEIDNIHSRLLHGKLDLS